MDKKEKPQEKEEQQGAPQEKEEQQAGEQVTEEQVDGQVTEEQSLPDMENEPKAKKPGRSATDKAREEIKKLDNALKESQDKYLRLSAEFDNYRKRTLKEKMDWNRYAGEEIFTRMLPVMDDLERALAHIKEATDMDAVKQGMELIYNKFRDYLNQQGVSEINALNQEFDTDQHEAVTKIPAPEPALKGKIVDVVEKGYMLNEKVIRYPKVVIGE